MIERNFNTLFLRVFALKKSSIHSPRDGTYDFSKWGLSNDRALCVKSAYEFRSKKSYYHYEHWSLIWSSVDLAWPSKN